MIGLRLHFELGRYHATPWGSNVNDAAIEWPPSPWRLLRALYSTGRTHADLATAQSDLDQALLALATAPPPTFELPLAIAAHTRHYMPVPGGKPVPSPSGRGEKTAKVLDGFLAINPEQPLVAWWDVELTAPARVALNAAVRSLGYLGRSESVCRAELIDGPGPQQPTATPMGAEAADASVEAELVDLLCPAGEDPLAALRTSVTEMRRDRLLVPHGTRWVTYAVDTKDARRGDAEATWQRQPLRRPQVALLRLTGGDRPGLFEAVRIGQLLRCALQSAFGKAAGGGASATFSGRAGENRRLDQHRHAHYLCLPDSHGRRVDRLVVWAPEGFGSEEVSALARLRKLYDRDHTTGSSIEMRVALTGLGTEDELQIPDLVGPSRKWRSLTPFALVRHPKRRGGRTVDGPDEQVNQELAHRGLPAPETIQLRNDSWHRFRSSKLGQPRLERKPLCGLELTFAEAVTGPIAIGALSHYGLGVLVPDRR